MPAPNPKPKLSVWFSDVALDKPDTRTLLQHPVELNLLLDFLGQHFNLTLNADTPQLWLYSIFGHRKCRYLGLRLFATGENVSPNEAHCDWSISFDQPTDRNIFFPLWALRDLSPLLHRAPMPPKHKLCAFAYTQSAHERNALWEGLAQHLRIDALSLMGQNTRSPLLRTRFAEHWFEALIQAYTPYKFIIAAENSSYDGYMSEKIFAAFLGRAIPIYWGDPKITDFINPEAFIHARDFADYSTLAKYILKLAQDSKRYQAYLDAPVFHQNKLPDAANWQELGAKLRAIIGTSKRLPIAQSHNLNRELASRLAARVLDQLFHEATKKRNRYPYFLPRSPIVPSSGAL